MKKTVSKILMTALVAGMLVPLAAHAADDELQKKIDALAKEVADLKSSVKKVEDKSLGKWLSIDGDYRFRVDSLSGQTKAYVNPNLMFANIGSQLQIAAINDPYGIGPLGFPNGQALTAFMNFGNTMKMTNTYAGAMAFLNPATNPLAGALPLLAPAGAVGAFAPKNETLYTNKFSLGLTAKATQDVTVHAKLDMYKTFGSQDDNAVTGNYFADRVGVFDGTLGHIPSDGMSEC